ncbi:hypothetical protein QTN47_13515 [Danxiaibacter flavus]|uniref:DUF3052 family protein n=1 Tax=Danxiaibacter flavus TaxID=3049108 RepID=A0ABV3ZF63_9BACT|nr:hypothetical protein QNM32_13520 [Chitinophagaceae bacterium DXS]
MAGYSSTPLAKKLGIKEHDHIAVINQPEYYFSLFSDLPSSIELVTDSKVRKNLIHYFTNQTNSYIKDLPKLKKQIEQNGMIWISWPKKSSNIETDLNENIIRNFALKNGLVDVKVCAVDDIWSGLKLVIPVKDRI